MDSSLQQITETVSPGDQEAYLEALEELTHDLKLASIAVTTGALSDFENSLVRQQISYRRLTELGKPHSAVAAAPDALSAPAAAMLDTRFKAAVAALDTELRSYSMLLKHFGETSRVFAGMFRRYGGSAGSGLPLPRSQSAWSCEL